MDEQKNKPFTQDQKVILLAAAMQVVQMQAGPGSGQGPAGLATSAVQLVKAVEEEWLKPTSSGDPPQQ